MGVWAADFFSQIYKKYKVFDSNKWHTQPIDDKYGIPEAIFQATLDNFTPENRELFYKRMFKIREDFSNFSQFSP